MNKPIIKRLGIAAAIVALLGGAAAVAISRSANSLLAEYPDCPFERIPLDTPRFIPVRDVPLDDKGYAAYQAERRKMWDYERAEGSEKGMSPEELAAFEAMNADRHVRSLELAEKILRTHPDSAPAMYVRAVALKRGNGNAAAALNQLRILRHLLEERGRKNPADNVARAMYLRCLAVEDETNFEMGREAETMRCLELIEQVYEPILKVKIGRLLEFGRLDEAEAAIGTMEKSGRWPTTAPALRRHLGYARHDRTGMLVVEEQNFAGNRHDPLAFRALAVAGEASFDFVHSEQMLAKATKFEDENDTITTSADLANLLIQEGKFAEAATALKKGAAICARHRPQTWAYDQGMFDQALGNLVLASGQLEVAERMFRRAYDRPAPLGVMWETKANREFQAALALWTVLRSRIAEMREADALDANPLAIDTQRHALEVECWLLEQRLINSTDQKQLIVALRPQLPENMKPWLAAGLVEMLPYCVAVSMIDAARAEEKLPAAGPYYDAFAAEAAWRAGRDDEALQLARRALAKLPVAGEKLLRARVQTVAAMAALRLRDTTECLKQLDPVLDAFPTVLRMLDATVPVQIESDGSESSARLAALLARSPRLRPDPNGLRISVHSADGKLTIEMFRLAGARHFELTVAIDGDDVAAATAAAYQQFHQRLASPAAGLDQSTINRLDGGLAAASEQDAIDNAMKNLEAKK